MARGDGMRCQKAFQLQNVRNVTRATQFDILSILGDYVCLVVIIDRNRSSDGISQFIDRVVASTTL